MKRAILISVIGLGLSASPSFAQMHQTGSTAAADRTFVANAARGGMAEVELGKLAQERGKSDEVKSFGKRMVDDHSRANDDLQGLARSKNITLPTALTAQDRALKTRLSKLSGSAFDRAYMSAMLSDHKKDVSEFQRMSASAKDDDVRAFAAKTLPTLQEHLKLAQDGTRAVGTSGVKR